MSADLTFHRVHDMHRDDDTDFITFALAIDDPRSLVHRRQYVTTSTACDDMNSRFLTSFDDRCIVFVQLCSLAHRSFSNLNSLSHSMGSTPCLSIQYDAMSTAPVLSSCAATQSSVSDLFRPLVSLALQNCRTSSNALVLLQCTCPNRAGTHHSLSALSDLQAALIS